MNIASAPRKLVTYDAGFGARPGVLVDTGEPARAGVASGVVIDLPLGFAHLLRRIGRPADPAAVAARYGADLLGVIVQADHALPAVRELLSLYAAGELPQPPGTVPGGPGAVWHPMEHVRLLAPIERPVSMRDGYAFRQHVEAARRNRGLPMIPEFDRFPIFYYTNHLSVVGPGPVLVQPDHLDKLDFELEAAVVLGRGGRNLNLHQADATIFGLMVMNDWSARGLQMEEMKLNLGPAKGKDFATALGPYLVPKEDLAPWTVRTPRGEQFALGMRAAVNGMQVAEGRLSDMSFTFAEIIQRASYGVTLHPGEVIGSGTVGTGCFLETNGSGVFDNWWLKPGDRVVCEVEQLGRLENIVELEVCP